MNKNGILKSRCVSFLLAALLLGASSCQTIPELERLVPVDPSSVQTNRTTLLCEFSGYKCTNCPTAAEEAQRLLMLMNPHLVVVEMHPPSNDFTRPTSRGDYDYTCPAADRYYRHFEGWNSVGFPTGIVNLAGSFTPHPLWSGCCIRSAVAQSPVELAASVRYDADSRSLSAIVTLDNLSAVSQSLQLIAWLTEDSVVGAQKMPDNSSRLDYPHRHLLRDTLTAVWGETLVVQNSLTYELKPYVLSEKYVAAHCHLVLLAMKDDEVVQAMQIPME